MQAVGGVRGFHKITFDDIETLSGEPQEIAMQNNISIPEALTLPSTAKTPLKATLAAVNGGNIIRLGDETNTPTQFTCDAADCRVSWTAENLVDVTTIWTKAVEYRWENGKCIQGSSAKASTGSNSTSTNVGSTARRLSNSGLMLGLPFASWLLS
jgi:YD repeat-containing protein